MGRDRTPLNAPLHAPTQAHDDQPDRPLWQLVVALLPAKDPETEWFNLADVAPLLNIKTRVLSNHARDLWPSHEGHWRLNYSQCVSLIRRVCYVGRKLPTRAQVLADLAERALAEASKRGGA